MRKISYRKVGSTYIIRLDKGQEIIPTLKAFCQEYQITAGLISGIGAGQDLTIGYFNTGEKSYEKKTFNGMYEITSLLGNISFVDNDLLLHLHINIADSNLNIYGGHLLGGNIGLTGEIFIQTLDTKIDKVKNDEFGINIFNL